MDDADLTSDIQSRMNDCMNHISAGLKKTNIIKSFNYQQSITNDGDVLCYTCGDPINKERLKILPDTLICISCARQAEESSKEKY